MGNTTLKRGDTVLIYSDPMTRTELEGKAILHKRINKDRDEPFERWEVIFYDEPSTTYERLIYTAK